MATLQTLLRPTERILLEIRLTTPPEQNPHPNVSQDDNERVLAIVTNERNGLGRETGSVFLLKWRRSAKLLILATIPIGPDFDVRASQSSSNNPSELARRPSEFSSKPGLLLSVTGDDQEVKVVCKDAEVVSEIISVTKRLRAIAIENAYDMKTSHSWLQLYSPKFRHSQSLDDVFTRPDLRIPQSEPRLSLAMAGSPGDEDADLLLIRDVWLRHQFKQQETEYLTSSDLLVRIGTFNVNGRPPPDDLKTWINGREAADVLVFGFQELDLSTEALIYATTMKEEMWCEAIYQSLGQVAYQFTKLVSKQLVGMLIVVFIRKALRPYVSDLTTSTVGVGVLGTMGNKGATAIRFRYKDTILTFVNSHLAAFDAMMAKRNQDYHELCRRLAFPLLAATPAMAAQQARPQTVSIFDCDVLFWAVIKYTLRPFCPLTVHPDLNYRIDLADDEVRELILSGPRDLNFQTLFQYDQLKRSMQADSAFSMFNEAPISFLPTYRHEPGTTRTIYDIKRRPAWTDRVLHLSADRSLVTQKRYSSHPDIVMSDHSPVSAEFVVRACDVDRSRRTALAVRLLKTLGDFEHSEETPKAKLSTHSIDLGPVQYMVSQTHHFNITNTGSLPCTFRFIPTDENAPICPPWLTLQPTWGLLLPQESLDFTLTVLVGDQVAALQPNTLEQMLIVHVERGLDYFIAITGQFLPSCFGRDLTSLVQLGGPVRSNADQLSGSKVLSAPRELMRLIDWLMTHGLNAVEDLFVAEGDASVMAQIRECLDTGEEFGFDTAATEAPGLAVAFGAVLIQLLSSLTTPIIPPHLFSACAQVSERYEAHEILANLPSTSANTWVSLTAFLHYLTLQSPFPEDRGKVISAIFAPVLLPDNPSRSQQISPLSARRFLSYFLT